MKIGLGFFLLLSIHLAVFASCPSQLKILATKWAEPIRIPYSQPAWHMSGWPDILTRFSSDSSLLKIIADARQDVRIDLMPQVEMARDEYRGILTVGNRYFLIALAANCEVLEDDRYIIEFKEISFIHPLARMINFYAGPDRWMLLVNEKYQPRAQVDLETGRTVVEWNDQGQEIQKSSSAKIEPLEQYPKWYMSNSVVPRKFQTPNQSDPSVSSRFLKIQFRAFNVEYSSYPQIYVDLLPSLTFGDGDKVITRLKLPNERVGHLLWTSKKMILFSMTEKEFKQSLAVGGPAYPLHNVLWTFEPTFEIAEVWSTNDNKYLLIASRQERNLKPELIVNVETGHLVESPIEILKADWLSPGSKQTWKLE